MPETPTPSVKGQSSGPTRRCRPPCRCCRWIRRRERSDAPGPRRRPVRSACSRRTGPMGSRLVTRTSPPGCADAGMAVAPITSIKVAKAAGMTDRFTVHLLVRLGRSLGRQGAGSSLRAHRQATCDKLDGRRVDMWLTACRRLMSRSRAPTRRSPGLWRPIQGHCDIEVPLGGSSDRSPGQQLYPCTPKPG